MVGIVIHWDLADVIKESIPAIKKMLSMWTLTAKCFGVDTVYVIATTDPMPFPVDTEIDFRIFSSLQEIRDLNIPLVFVDQRGEPLADFIHPAECLYIFGSDYGHGAVYDEGETAISIPCVAPNLYAHIACGIVLHDRYTK